jgi:hypothetical protein
VGGGGEAGAKHQPQPHRRSRGGHGRDCQLHHLPNFVAFHLARQLAAAKFRYRGFKRKGARLLGHNIIVVANRH